jgi:hypothetical protein
MELLEGERTCLHYLTLDSLMNVIVDFSSSMIDHQTPKITRSSRNLAANLLFQGRKTQPRALFGFFRDTQMIHKLSAGSFSALYYVLDEAALRCSVEHVMARG